MTGIHKHNRKSWSDYERYSTHVYDEKFLLELFHNERDYEQQFLCETGSPLIVSNAKMVNWKSDTNYVSRDGGDYYLKAKFSAPVTGDYNVEVLYRTEEEGAFITLWVMDNNEINYHLKGSSEYRTREIHDYHLQKGEHEFNLHCNANIHVLGIVIKNIVEYRADDTLKRDSRLTLIKATHTVSKMVGADELKVELLYDNSWKDPISLTDYIFDYREEVNFHLINTEGEMEQVFGGYVSACTLNSQETILTISCAGRLIDGEKRYIVEEMSVGGDASNLEDNYPLEYTRKFDNYNDATEYLFDNYEQPLNSNMHEIITAKQYDSISFDVMSMENYHRCISENVITELLPMGAYLRNNNGINTQRWFIYNRDWFGQADPICLDDFPIFYVKYGMGEEVTTLEAEQTQTDTSNDAVSTGGVITVNMMPSCGCCVGTPYKHYTKSWKNYCPACGKSGTLTDNPKGVYEGEITCSMSKGGCDADYCGYCGGDKWGSGRCRWRKLTPASGSEVSSNSGDSSTTENISHSTFNVFMKIIGVCSKYSYGAGVSTVNEMRKKGFGDDIAFSDLIYSELVDMGVGAKITQYPVSGMTRDFRSVLVKNTEGKYVDFPYLGEEWQKQFGTVFNPTSQSTTGTMVAEHDGMGVEMSTGTITGTNAVSNGFDKDKPFKCYWVLEYSIYGKTDPNLTATLFIDLPDGTYYNGLPVTNGKGTINWGNTSLDEYEGEYGYTTLRVHSDVPFVGTISFELPNGTNVDVECLEGEGIIDWTSMNGYNGTYTAKEVTAKADTSHHLSFIDFTASQSDDHMTWSGLTPIFLNNIINTSTLSVIDKMREFYRTPHVYLHKLYCEYVVGAEELWSNSESNTDNSSYRMILQEVGFRNGTLLNPVDLGSTGKTINSVLQTVVDNGELKLKFYPARHRRDDKVILTKDKSFNPSFVIDESKNVLNISNWSFTPVSDFIDRSLVVFKNKVDGDADKGAVYNYTESRNPNDILRYGEINKLTSLSDDISSQEAYYNARKEFKSVVGDSMTITVFGCPKDLHIGDYVECLFEDDSYNDVKEVKSIERTYSINQAPHIQTKLGLNRPDPELSLRNKFEEERKVAKEHKTLFSRTAVYDDEVYTWEE